MQEQGQGTKGGKQKSGDSKGKGQYENYSDDGNWWWNQDNWDWNEYDENSWWNEDQWQQQQQWTPKGKGKNSSKNKGGGSSNSSGRRKAKARTPPRTKEESSGTSDPEKGQPRRSSSERVYKCT
eukprot:s14158_g1.t1